MKLPPALVYTVLRLLAFLVPFGVLMLFPVFREMYWLAAIFAALIGLSLSLIFLRRPLAEVSQQVEARASRRRVSDEEAEDAAAATAPSHTPPNDTAPSDAAPNDTAPGDTAAEASDADETR